MQISVKWGLACVLAMTAVAAAGCGSKDGGKLPTASIGGESESSQSHGEGGGQRPTYDRLHPIVEMHIARGNTTLGDIRVKLDAEHAGLTVDNFLSYVEQGHYDNTLIHQVTTKPIAVVLGGGYDTFGKERPCGSAIRNEAHNGLKNHRGTIAMARRPDAIDSSTAQFFINLSDNPDLDYKKPADYKKLNAASYGYCVFGEVVSGMEIADQIGQAEVHDTPKLARTPVEPIVIKWVHVVR